MTGTAFTDVARSAICMAPANQAIYARIDAAVCEDVADGIDRQEHVEHVTLTILQARGLA